MTYFLNEGLNLSDIKKFNADFKNKNKNKHILFKSLYKKDEEMNQKIPDKNKNPPQNEIYISHCRFINPYELLGYTVSPRPPITWGKNYRFPSSRAYYKMYEILHNLKKDVFTPYKINGFLPKDYYCAHIAEGPGGFIEAMTTYFNLNRLDDGNDSYENHWKAITLKDTEAQSLQFDLPYNVRKNIIYGPNPSSNGDITNPENSKYFADKVKSISNGKGAMIITADGGMEVERYDKEVEHLQLFWGEVITALACQREGGIFILKTYNLFYEWSAIMVYLLGAHYKNVDIIKPGSSRVCNNEKYIVCTDFKGISDKLLNQLFESMNSVSFPSVNMPESFTKSLKNINKTFFTFQSQYVNRALKSYSPLFEEKITKGFGTTQKGKRYYLIKNPLFVLNLWENAFKFRNTYFYWFQRSSIEPRNPITFKNIEKIALQKINKDHLKRCISIYQQKEQKGIEEHFESKLYPLRKFHNFVKKYTLKNIVKKLTNPNFYNSSYKGNSQLHLLDLASGRGGDMNKWYDTKQYIYDKKFNRYIIGIGGISNVIGIDNDKDAVKEAILRYQNNLINEIIYGVNAQFKVGDLSKKSFKEYIPNDIQKFDIITCHFAIHYFFSNTSTINSFIKQISQYLKTGGICIISAMDSKEINKILKNNIFENDTIKIEKSSSKQIKVLYKDTIYFKDRGISEEYLVDSDKLINIAKENNLILQDSSLFRKYYNEYKSMRNSILLTKDQEIVSFLNSIYIFEKN